MKVYAPMWFTIKSRSSCKDIAKHLWMTIHNSRYLSEHIRAIVDPVIQHNGYFGHPESMLLSMLTDETQYAREPEVRRFLRAWACNKVNVKIRISQVPPLNFDAEDYTELIDWQSCTVTESPATKSMCGNESFQIRCHWWNTCPLYSSFRLPHAGSWDMRDSCSHRGISGDCRTKAWDGFM